MYVIIFTLIMLITIIYSNFFIEDDKHKEGRLKQYKKHDEESLRELISNKIDKKVKKTRKEKAMQTIVSAGYDNVSYADYILIKIGLGFLGFLIGNFLMNNMPIGIVLFIAFFMLPTQYLTFVSNKRLDLMNEQVGPFLNMVTKLYTTSGNFEKSIILTMDEFKGIMPLEQEIKRTVADISAGKPVTISLLDMAERNKNEYLHRFANYYQVAKKLGNKETTETLLNQAYLQHTEDAEIRGILRQRIREQVFQIYFMIAAVPFFFFINFFFMSGTKDFWLNNPIGKIYSAILVVATLLAFWFANKFLGRQIK